ncbi:MAG: hypothetical protein ACT4QF_09610 [Sporichthyaceae bacterium]
MTGHHAEGTAASQDQPSRDLALLLRLNRSWRQDMSATELYEVTRGWWVMSAANAHRVRRVLAVAGGVVREVYEPDQWLTSPVPGEENRIGFAGAIATDREDYLDRDVSDLFRPGSANPVRYLPMATLQAVSPTNEASIGPEPNLELAVVPVEPGLVERARPLFDAFGEDLLWAQSRAGQELFHSNTLAWLLHRHPGPMHPLLALLGNDPYPTVDRVDIWRERRNLDVVIDPVGAHPKVVVENKLYSVPYPAQLTKYNAYPLPWSPGHGPDGAAGTRYVLLSLMTPTFPLPSPWVHVGYRDLAEVLDLIDPTPLGPIGAQFEQYRILVRRLVALAEAVDPAQALDEPFIVTDLLADLPDHGLDASIAKMRFSQLAQVIQSAFAERKSFEVGGDRDGLITYWRPLPGNRRIGWQFQEGQLRYWIGIGDEHLQGAGARAERERIVEAEHLDFFDHTEIEAILGDQLRPKTYRTTEWLGFNPDFVYRHRPVRPTVTTAALAEALIATTRRVDRFAALH